jgi:flagellar M-ring protein FliF
VNLEQLLTRLKGASATLSARQMTVLAAAFLAAVGLTIGSAYWLNAPTYGVLFSDMDAESAAGIVSKLKAEKIQYALDDAGRTIRVPAARVDELRLQFASDGLTGGGRVGFELFDRTAFGVTDFLEHVNYRRALEGELARTISTIAEVASARVHIAIPQPSLFTAREQSAKASVVLKLRNNRPLLASTVTAITGLVSASVESLRPESVVIIDNYGRPLSKPSNDADEAAGAPLERQQGIERDLATRVVNMLEPIVGVGRVRVNVSAKLRSDVQDEIEERWDPAPVVRSHQSVIQTGPAPRGAAAGTAAAATAIPVVAGTSAQGVAGSRANLPAETPAGDEAAPAPGAPGTLVASTDLAPGSNVSQTTNYEVSKITRHSTLGKGSLARLSVAVVLDDEHATTPDGKAAAKPRAPADIQKIHGLVAAAVGFDAERGDQITVENIAFEEAPIEAEPSVSPWEQYKPLALDAARMLGIVVLGLVAMLGVIRPIVRGSLGTAAPAGAAGALPTPRTVQDLEAEMDAQLEGAAGARRMPVLTKRVAALTQREPENAARLLRTWLSEPER